MAPRPGHLDYRQRVADEGGIDAVPGEHLRVADDAATMADALSSIFDDPDAAATMGRAARARMIARYGWDARLAPLGEMLGLPA